ncbi:MAG: dUTP diphosphatase [Actinobacteria bacterium]|nr:dUTP diphosphatase [Actinomycetota bacterium]
MSLEVKFIKIDPEAPGPEYAHTGDAGCDLTSRINAVLDPGERALVPTGIAVSIPEGFAGFIQPRSGLASRHGVSIVNTPGLIDSHYRGEIKVILVNLDRNEPFRVNRGDKICQLVIQKVEQARFTEVEKLDPTKRGTGGFGSTGK